MNMRAQPPSPARRPAWSAWLTILVVVSCVSIPLRAQLNKMATLRNFKIVDYFSPKEMAPGQTNQVKALLTGAEAQPRPGGLVLVRQMRLDSLRPDGGTNFIIRAPECVFDYEERMARSTGRLDVASADGQFLISGRQGFACWLTNTHFNLSNRVRTEIHHDLTPLDIP